MMTKYLQVSLGFLGSTLLLVVGSLLGLCAYLFVASAAGWTNPIWWGGEALLLPVVFGGTVLVVGGAAFLLICRWMAAVLGRRLTGLGQLVGGVIIGALLMPTQKLIASWLTAIPGWEAMAPMASVFVTLAAAAICSAVAASLLVAFFPRTSAG